MKRFVTWLVQFALPPVALAVLVLAAWGLAVHVLDVPKYVVPSPKLVWLAAREHAGDLWTGVQLTATTAVYGFAASFVVGTALGLVFSQSRMIQRAAYPYAIFLQTVPIVAIAPLIAIWFDNGIVSVSIVAFIISLFPIIANATAGLSEVDPVLVELFRLHNASRWQILWKLRLPNSVPYLVAGAKVSCGLSVIGSIVGEMFVGSGIKERGLGVLINQACGRMHIDDAFAALFTSTLLGVAMFGAVSLVGDWIVARRGGQRT